MGVGGWGKMLPLAGIQTEEGWSPGVRRNTIVAGEASETRLPASYILCYKGTINGYYMMYKYI